MNAPGTPLGPRFEVIAYIDNNGKYIDGLETAMCTMAGHITNRRTEAFHHAVDVPGCAGSQHDSCPCADVCTCECKAVVLDGVEV